VVGHVLGVIRFLSSIESIDPETATGDS
jgi:hypothetical protein